MSCDYIYFMDLQGQTYSGKSTGGGPVDDWNPDVVVSQVILGVLEKPVSEHVQVVLLVYWNNTLYCTVLFLNC